MSHHGREGSQWLLTSTSAFPVPHSSRRFTGGEVRTSKGQQVNLGCGPLGAVGDRTPDSLVVPKRDKRWLQNANPHTTGAASGIQLPY